MTSIYSQNVGDHEGGKKNGEIPYEVAFAALDEVVDERVDDLPDRVRHVGNHAGRKRLAYDGTPSLVHRIVVGQEECGLAGYFGENRVRLRVFAAAAEQHVPEVAREERRLTADLLDQARRR